MTNYQCPDLASYAALWLEFRDPELRAEIIEHRENCGICTALRKATDERGKLQRTADICGEISIEFPQDIRPELASILRRLYQITVIREGDIGWVYPGDGSGLRRVVGSMGTAEQTVSVDGAAAGNIV